MAIGHWSVVLKNVQRAFEGRSVAGLSEGQLLERFLQRRDEAAFEAILVRHGPMVLGVCRGILRDPHDVEDAFQATFLILVKKANALRDQDRLAAWLYRVAHRVALRARLEASKRRAVDTPSFEETFEARPTPDVDLRELQGIVRDEVERLSHQERAAIVTCYLEGLTHEEAAERLGWPVGTVKGRLARARDHLRDRLTRRGVSLPAGAVVSALSQGASPVVPLELIASTTLVATRVAAGQTLLAGIVSSHVVLLTEGVIATMSMTRWKLGALALIMGSIATPAVLAWQSGADGDKPKPEVDPTRVTSKKVEAVEMTVLAASDLIKEAREALEVVDQMKARGSPAPNEISTLWARRLLDASTTPAVSPAERIAAFREYLDWMKKLYYEVVERQKSGNGTYLDVMDASYRYHEAERWLKEAQFTPSTPSKTMPTGDKPRQSVSKQAEDMAVVAADQPRTRAIMMKLEERISMNFPNETPLEDVIKYITQSTQDEKQGLPNGIPIYIEPKGLNNADKTMASTVALSLEGIPLRTTLRLMLEQIDLVYKVENGLLVITSRDRANKK